MHILYMLNILYIYIHTHILVCMYAYVHVHKNKLDKFAKTVDGILT